MVMGVATEEHWKAKCAQIGIPYFEKCSSQKAVTKIDLKPKSTGKTNKERALLNPTHRLISQPSELIRKGFQNMNFQEVSQMKVKLDMTIDREEDDEIYLKEYQLTPRDNPVKNKPQNLPLKSSSKHEAIAQPTAPRKLSTIRGRRPQEKEK